MIKDPGGGSSEEKGPLGTILPAGSSLTCRPFKYAPEHVGYTGRFEAHLRVFLKGSIQVRTQNYVMY